MRYIIIGAGAIGGAIGARLHQSGQEVVLVARGEHHAALRERGLTLQAPDGSHTLRIPVVRGPEEIELRGDDVFFLAVKTQDTASILAAWAARPVSGGGSASRLPLVCLQNGVESERMALRHFRHVYAACVVLPAAFLTPGVVRTWCGPRTGALVLGCFPEGSDETVQRIADDLRGSTFRTLVADDAMRWKYGKLLGNLANAVDALCGRAADGQLQELIAGARAEAVEVLKRSGIAYAEPEELAELRRGAVDEVTGTAAEPGHSSTWQSLRRGSGSAEVDYLNGEIAMLGRACGVPTPVNEALQQLVNTWARERREPGGLAPSRLAELLAHTAVPVRQGSG
ncbi:ketopantoate reductase family protein [Streptomyces sp. XD-27]|uniref:ketopantoate reductase family protein n=1 Tax=Streptomyces sp. XD-27 TaxID=3062779 RepID=UPI0026F428E2|nr:2-dehydropantoate 2-reductase [Streptomyces sp. XD-27]WKX73504.1 2-dehydropantoate 2-reductase [Streptomyces sp. XD-27]